MIASVNLGLSTPTRAESSVKDDYIQNCKYATCVGMAGSEWSEQHPYGVAIGVRSGTNPAVTDAKIKAVLTRDLNYYGITDIKFFYEQNDVRSSTMSLHVRGGTKGPFNISNVRQQIKTVAELAKMDAKLFN